MLPYDVAEERRLVRQPTLPMSIQRDRIEEAGKAFFERAAEGYKAIAAAEPKRIRTIDADGSAGKQISERICEIGRAVGKEMINGLVVFIAALENAKGNLLRCAPSAFFAVEPIW